MIISGTATILRNVNNVTREFCSREQASGANTCAAFGRGKKNLPSLHEMSL